MVHCVQLADPNPVRARTADPSKDCSAHSRRDSNSRNRAKSWAATRGLAPVFRPLSQDFKAIQAVLPACNESIKSSWRRTLCGGPSSRPSAVR